MSGKEKRDFGADRDLKGLYYTYLAITVLGGFIWWLIPIVAIVVFRNFLIGLIVALTTVLPLFLISLITATWIPRFHSSIQYVLDDTEIVVSKGVWWKTRSVVPYNRITNINVYQGPISRRYGLAKLSIQTAGFSGTTSSGQKAAEAEIIGVKQYEEIKDHIMDHVRKRRPEAVEAEAEEETEKGIEKQILHELQRIRKAVEKKPKEQK